MDAPDNERCRGQTPAKGVRGGQKPFHDVHDFSPKQTLCAGHVTKRSGEVRRKDATRRLNLSRHPGEMVLQNHGSVFWLAIILLRAFPLLHSGDGGVVRLTAAGAAPEWRAVVGQRLHRLPVSPVPHALNRISV
jgi:hypothetical protein